MAAQFDLIIVGGGTAGSILADRMTASGKLRVLLVEAGRAPNSRFASIPAGFDGWAAAGASRWGGTDVAPAFRAQEHWTGGPDPLRGNSGPLQVTANGNARPLTAAWVQAARAARCGCAAPTRPRRRRSIRTCSAIRGSSTPGCSGRAAPALPPRAWERSRAEPAPMVPRPDQPFGFSMSSIFFLMLAAFQLGMA